MKNHLFFMAMAFAFTNQSCGDSHKEIVDLDKGRLANEPNVEVSNKEGKYFCDFHWTSGYKDWEYDFSSDNPVGTDEVIAPWCLVPYGSGSEYVFSFKSAVNETHYACRDRDSSFYKMLNELPEEIYIDCGPNDRIMKCIALKSDETRVYVGPNGTTQQYPNGTPDLPGFRNDRLYHVIKIDEHYYSIEGHLNLKLVKPVTLSVLIAFIDAENVKISLDNHKTEMVDSLKSYLKKAGFTLSINPNSIRYATGSEGLMQVNGLYNSGYDYVIGVRYNNTKREILSNASNVFVISDGNDFFGADPKEKARLLAALLYSRILGKNPISGEGQDGHWLSYYTKSLDFSQPSNDWEIGRPAPVKIQSEFAQYLRW